MANQKFKIINKFFGGAVRDDKSNTPGASANVEELDIFENENAVKPTQIFSTDSMPASTEIYDYTGGNDDTVYGYGKETSGNKVRLVSVSSGGSDNPGSFSTLFTSADSSDVAYLPSFVKFFETDENNTDYLYYLTNNSGTVKLKRYDIDGDSESETDANSDPMTLSGLNGSFDRVFAKEVFGELMVGNGQFIAKVDKDGIFTEKAFTLPNGWEAVDIVPVSDIGIILARNKNRLTNSAKGFWWDLTSTAQVDDSFNLPWGGPQWIFNHKETIKIMCAINSQARFYQLSGAFPGAVPVELPGLRLDNIAAETSTQPISAPHYADTFGGILYFNVYKTDKSGVYNIGQLDSNKPTAITLAKRFATTDYSNHTPRGLLIQGPNFYASFDDDGTEKNVRVETQNDPARSSNAIYESVILDENDPTVDKDIKEAYIITQPLPASTSVSLEFKGDYGSYSSITRPDGTSFNTQSGVIGFFKVNAVKKKTFQFKLTFSSNGTDTPTLTEMGYRVLIQDNTATK